MIPLIACCLGAACISAALIRHMIRVGVMDVPVERSSHTRPTPKGGGIGVVVAFLLVFPISQLWTQGDLPGASLLLPLMGAALLSLFSWLDDIHSYRAALKLGVQGAASMMVLAGVALAGPFINENFHALQALLTAFLPGAMAALLCTLILVATGFLWLVYTTNALNFIDGLNGLASGVMIVAALTLALVFYHAQAPAFTHAALILAVALLAFMPFNYPKARIFMGDVGSQGAGLVIAWLGIEAACTTRYPLIAPFVLSGVLYDVGFTLVRRALAGDALAQAHRSHLYQLAARSGIAPVIIAPIHWAFAIWGGLVCIQPAPLALRLGLILAPQLSWAALVILRARARDLGKW